MLRAFVYWLPMIVIALLNAAIREMWFVKSMSQLTAHQWSTLTLIVLTTIYVLKIFKHLRITSGSEALITGSIWLVLTLGFEFSIGIAANRSWEYMLTDYNLLTGHLWPLYLLSLFLMPFIGFKIFQKQNQFTKVAN